MSRDKVEVRPISIGSHGNYDGRRNYRIGRTRREGAGIDVLRQMVQFMAQRLMAIDVEWRCGAGSVEKSAERINSRNGFRDRSWETRADNAELKVPQSTPRQLLP